MVGAVRQAALAGRGGHPVEGRHHQGEGGGEGGGQGGGEPEDQEDCGPLPDALLCALPEEDLFKSEEGVLQHGKSGGFRSP